MNDNTMPDPPVTPQPITAQSVTPKPVTAQPITHNVTAPRPRVRASQNAVARLHAELDGIAARPITDVACRQAMLDCLIRSRSLIGGVWFRIEGENALADVQRLQTELLQRADIRRWIGKTAAFAVKGHADVFARCPQVRGLQAICVPVAADRRGTNRDAGTSKPEEFDRMVLVGLISGNQTVSEETELLAAQCVVRAYRDWHISQHVNQSKRQLLATSALLELTNDIAASDRTIVACQTLASAMHEYFHAKFVAVALNETARSDARLVCVSGIGEFDPKSEQAGRLEAALNETIVRGELTNFPAPSEADRHQHLAHKRVAETTGVEAMVSIPLRDRDEEVIGAVALGGDALRLLDPQTKLIMSAASVPIGSSIKVARQTEGGLAKRTMRRTKEFIERKRGKLVLLALVTTIALMFLPATYRIGCRCRAEPVSRRYSLAPYDGLIENTFAQPGDRVKQGDLVARMAGHEIGWELAGVTADTQRANKQRDVHMAELEIADSLMSEMEMEKLHAREKLMRHRLANLELRSPVDGIVLSGSLDRRENYPVKIGEVLYEIAPIDPIRLEVAIPSDELMHVEPGMTVQVRIDGEDEGQIEGTISRIQPRSETRDEQNVFVAEVIVPNPDGALKPGMEGSARVLSHQYTIGWNVCHRAWERLVTRIWW